MATPKPIDLRDMLIVDAMLLKLSGVEAGRMTGHLTYFVRKKMFACICIGECL